MNPADEKYMQAALRLARRGLGSVEPNPAVGAVLVKSNQIIGKGWHKKFGAAHAEAEALADCRKHVFSPQGATMYVTLEPCCHKGKTSPCTAELIAAKVARVVVATIDPSEHANGKGIKQLRNAGIEVETGVCETEARLLNAPFIKFAKTGKSWVALKWAQSIDGKLSFQDKSEQQWISGEESRKDIHKLRRRVQGILVGINTVIADNPLLTARPSGDKKAARIVLDSNLRIPLESKLLSTAKKTPVIVVASQHSLHINPEKRNEIAQKGAEVIAYPDTGGRSNLYFLMDELVKRGITQLLVEGGPTVIASFLKERLADEIHIYIAPKLLGSSGSVDISDSMAGLAESVGLCHVDIKTFGDDVKITGFSEETVKNLEACFE